MTLRRRSDGGSSFTERFAADQFRHRFDLSQYLRIRIGRQYRSGGL